MGEQNRKVPTYCLALFYLNVSICRSTWQNCKLARGSKSKKIIFASCFTSQTNVNLRFWACGSPFLHTNIEFIVCFFDIKIEENLREEPTKRVNDHQNRGDSQMTAEASTKSSRSAKHKQFHFFFILIWALKLLVLLFDWKTWRDVYKHRKAHTHLIKSQVRIWLLYWTSPHQECSSWHLRTFTCFLSLLKPSEWRIIALRSVALLTYQPKFKELRHKLHSRCQKL